MGRRRKPISSVQLGAAIHRTVHPARPPDTDRVATQHSLLRTSSSSPPTRLLHGTPRTATSVALAWRLIILNQFLQLFSKYRAWPLAQLAGEDP